MRAYRSMRFIPTRVGNRVWLVVWHRGETGSSPPAWGTELRLHLRQQLDRFIPTRVGNRYFSDPLPSPQSVHPHPRGEQASASTSRSLLHGSSPPAWGTETVGRVVVRRARFIPTRVGNSGSWSGSMRGRSVHPHPRGEQQAILYPLDTLTGSSPPAWGTGVRRPRGVMCQGFIPTRVGNRGLPHKTANSRLGSSPPAWGTGDRRPALADHRRFIPTRVGNSRR